MNKDCCSLTQWLSLLAEIAVPGAPGERWRQPRTHVFLPSEKCGGAQGTGNHGKGRGTGRFQQEDERDQL